MGIIVDEAKEPPGKKNADWGWGANFVMFFFVKSNLVLNPFQIVRRLTFLTPSLTTCLIQKIV